MKHELRLRRAVPEDREVLEGIAKQTRGLEFPEDVFAWPTVECYVVEDQDGEILGFGYLEAIPEAHFVMRRRGVGQRTKRTAIELLHAGARKIAETLRLPAIRYPVTPDVPALATWISGLPDVQGDPRVHLALVRRGEKW